MSSSQLQKYIVTPLVISASVFGALGLPLALFGKQPVTIQLQGESVFYGQLRDVASPYLGLTSAISLGAGVASIAVTGWRSSNRKSSQVQAQLSDLSQHLKAKEAQLEALQLSEAKLEASGLQAFVDETVPLEQAIETEPASQKAKPMVEVQVITTQAVEAQAFVSPSRTVQAAAAKFASAQSFLGYSQTKAHLKGAIPTQELNPCEVEQLHNQVQQLMAQMASVQITLAKAPSTVKSESLLHEKAQPQVTQSWSVHSVDF